MEGLLSTLKLRYSLIFHYGSNKAGYVFLKTLCILIFIIPFFVYGIFDFIVEMILLIPSYIPIIGLLARFICFILGSINSLFFILLTLADIFYKSENAQVIEKLNDSGHLQ